MSDDGVAAGAVGSAAAGGRDPVADGAVVGLPDSESARATAQLGRIEQQRRHLWTTVLISMAVASLVVVVMSYWTDVVPDRPARVDFRWLRFAFLVLSIGFTVYSIRRERMLSKLAGRLHEERERAQVLESKMADADQTSQMRADIVATVTHELKTPLTSLLGYATILRKRDATLTPEQREEFFSVMEKQGRRIMQLIEELLHSSKVEHGTRLRRVPLDLQGIVGAIANEIATGRGRKVEFHAPVDDLGLFGDPTAIEHIVTNLVDNALKHSSPDSVVRVSIVEGDGEILVSVADDGDGIHPDELPHVFERFQQAGNARGRGSVGLGLYIVRNLVRAHGGRVWVDSEHEKGATFTVAFPRRRR